jgi:hypothetical protein
VKEKLVLFVVSPSVFNTKLIADINAQWIRKCQPNEQLEAISKNNFRSCRDFSQSPAFGFRRPAGFIRRKRKVRKESQFQIEVFPLLSLRLRESIFEIGSSEMGAAAPNGLPSALAEVR